MTNEIAVFLADYPTAIQELARGARGVVLTVVPQASETLDRPARMLAYSLGPGYKGLLFTIILGKAGVSLGIPAGASLPDPRGLLEGEGKIHRHVKLKTLSDLKKAGLKPLLKARLAAWKSAAAGKRGAA
jgi:hypothetical protein